VAVFGLGRRSKNVVGLDIGSSTIKLVKLDKRAGGYALSTMGIRELAPEDIVAKEVKSREKVIFEIQALVDQCDPKIRDVAISVAGIGVITDKITIDKKTGVEAEQVILLEAEQRAAFDVEDVTMDYHVVRVDEETNKMDVMLVAARNDFLRSYIDLVTDAGLRPLVVDTDSFSVYNSYEINYEIDPTRTIALVNIGFDITNLIFVKDGMYHTTRDVSNGGRLIFDGIQKEMRLTQDLTQRIIKGVDSGMVDQEMLKAVVSASADELAVGIEVAFSYFKSSTRVDEIDWIMMSGGGALIPYLPDFIQDKLNIPVEISNPLRNIEYNPDAFGVVQPDSVAPLLGVAVGLATRTAKS
jgi:type IV pilus assembly protein PilM